MRTAPPNVRGRAFFYFIFFENANFLLVAMWIGIQKLPCLVSRRVGGHVSARVCVRACVRFLSLPSFSSSHVWGQDASSPLSLGAFIRGSDQ